MLHCDWLGFFTAVIGAFRSSMSLSCFLGSPMSCGLFFLFSPWASTLQDFLYTPMALLMLLG